VTAILDANIHFVEDYPSHDSIQTA
jgi:hypothetical protein